MTPIDFIVLAIGGVGHVILWVAIVNRIHALGIQRKWIDLLTLFSGMMLAIVPLIFAGAWFFPIYVASSARFLSLVAWTYFAVCASVCIVTIFQRWTWYHHPERHGALQANHTSIVRLADEHQPLAAPGIPSWLSYMPANEVFTLSVQEKQIAIPRLSQSHGPLRIIHLSDLHMSGRITRFYFERVVEEVNARDADFIAITGDIIEREKCIEWIPATLGRLNARGGVYYVLGNHDRHVNENRLKAALADAGLVYLGGTQRQVTIRGVPILLAGNELPWYKPAASLADCPVHDPAGLPMRIVLAHSPDQFQWAQANDVDLILAGHLHGGQVCFPKLGAILAPSHHGVRYAAGVFTSGKTVMHVSRGTGSLTPVRYNCPPEIAVLSLTGRR
jgi:uncharacterized protein